MMADRGVSGGPAEAKVRIEGQKRVDGINTRAGKPHDGVVGIVLAGVHAWGGDVLERAACRPLWPIAARPLVWHAIDWLRRGGVRQACVCGNSDTTALRDALGDGTTPGIPLKYCEDPMPRGPAGCARDAAVGKHASAFVLIEGTVVPRIDLAALVNDHVRSGAAVTVVTGENGQTSSDPWHAAEPRGIYVFSADALQRVPATGYQDIKEALIPYLYRRGTLVAVHRAAADSIHCVRDSASYSAVSMWAVRNLAGELARRESWVRVDQAWVHPSARVHPTVRFVGPALVGPGSALGAGAVVIGPVAIGSDCAIAEQAVVSRSTIWDRCTVGAGASLDRCVLSFDTDIKPGSSVRNTVCVPCRPLRRKLPRWLTSFGRRVRPQVSARQYGDLAPCPTGPV